MNINIKFQVVKVSCGWKFMLQNGVVMDDEVVEFPFQFLSKNSFATLKLDVSIPLTLSSISHPS